MEENKELNDKKQCDINGVVKSFYCYDKSKQNKDKCSKQCDYCLNIDKQCSQ